MSCLGSKGRTHHAQSPHVTFRIVWLVLTELRSEVKWGANDSLGHGTGLGKDLCEFGSGMGVFFVGEGIQPNVPPSHPDMWQMHLLNLRLTGQPDMSLLLEVYHDSSIMSVLKRPSFHVLLSDLRTLPIGPCFPLHWERSRAMDFLFGGLGLYGYILC